MKRAVLLLVCLSLFGGCAAGPTGAAAPSGPKDLDPERSVAIYAAVVRQLVTKDHTFGRGESPFNYVYVVDGAVEDAGNPEKNGDAGEPFSSEMQSSMKEELADLPPLEFVRDPDSVRTGEDGLGGVKNDGVIITLGPIPPGNGKVKVENSLWCSGLCGQWLTYVLKRTGDDWRVIGTTGPAAIS